MEIGFVGLGRMGKNMVFRLLDGKQKVVAWNRSPEPLNAVARKGAIKAKDYADMMTKLKKPRVIWLMLPAGKVTEGAFQEFLGLLDKGDILIDGGNSNFHDTIRRHKEAKKNGINFLDIGVSGGVAAAKTGYGMMAGGDKKSYEKLQPALKAMCQSYGRVGEGGTGHYVKMVHNAIEYGMMQAIGEGMELLERGRFPKTDLKEVTRIWTKGCIISGFLMDMTYNALQEQGRLEKTFPYIEDNGEGKWTVVEAMEYDVPFSVNSEALMARYYSRNKNSFSHRMLAEIRNQFGGHEVKRKK